MSEHPADSALARLELTLSTHQQWAESLIAGILANKTPAEENLLPGAYMLCDFGKWYYSQDHSTVLTEQPLFKSLEKNTALCMTRQDPCFRPFLAQKKPRPTVSSQAPLAICRCICAT